MAHPLTEAGHPRLDSPVCALRVTFAWTRGCARFGSPSLELAGARASGPLRLDSRVWGLRARGCVPRMAASINFHRARWQHANRLGTLGPNDQAAGRLSSGSRRLPLIKPEGGPARRRPGGVRSRRACTAGWYRATHVQVAPGHSGDRPRPPADEWPPYGGDHVAPCRGPRLRPAGRERPAAPRSGRSARLSPRGTTPARNARRRGRASREHTRHLVHPAPAAPAARPARGHLSPAP